jgi:hypothetical protein
MIRTVETLVGTVTLNDGEYAECMAASESGSEDSYKRIEHDAGQCEGAINMARWVSASLTRPQQVVVFKSARMIAMTDGDRTQLEKDVLYNEHKTKAELGAYIVNLQRMQQDLQKWSEHLKMLANMLDQTDLPVERATQWRMFPDVDLKEVLSNCDEAIAVRLRLDGIQSQKKKLGL